MAISIAKLAPTAIVFAGVSYCCWPYLDPPRAAAGAQTGSKLPEIAAGKLKPVIVVNSNRDPFGNTVRALVPGDELPSKEKGKKDKDAANKSKSAAGEKAGTKPGSEPVKRPPAKIDTSDLTLNATFLRGDRRVAVINNKIYSEGDTLAKTDAISRPLKVYKITQLSIVLEREGVTAELIYPRPEAKSAEKEKSTNYFTDWFSIK